MVRQAGILSPKLFALYMNGLTNELCKSYAGCYINDKCIHHSMYVADILLMAPTRIVRQNLLGVYNYGIANYILLNLVNLSVLHMNLTVTNHSVSRY